EVSRERETPVAADFGLNIGAGALLDVSGRWVNDLPGSGPGANLGAVAIDGGEIRLSAHSDLRLAAGSVLDASGGAQVASNGKLSYGDAGSIDLSSGGFGQQNTTDPMTTRINLGGELRGYGMENGGTLNVTASSIHMGVNPTGQPGELVLDEGFFGRGGFREFNLTGVDGVNVADGFQLRPAPLSAQLAPGFSIKASGSDMAALTTLLALPADYRAPTRVSLTTSNFSRGDIRVGEGASIRVDPEGEIALSANRQLTVLGTLEAAAGHIVLKQPELAGNEHTEIANFDPGRSIFLGANSQLLATGYYRAEPDAQNLRKGEVLDGGSVEIEAAKGYLVTQQGSVIDVSGTEATLDIVGPSGLAATPVASNGGAITLAAREGMLLEGALSGRAGGSEARGGSLAVELDRMGKKWSFIGGTPIPLDSQRVVTLQAAPTVLTAGLVAGDALDTASLNGQAKLAQSQVRDGGFADLSLQSENRVAFADTLDMRLTGQLSVYAANLSAVGSTQTRLTAASAIIGNPDKDAQGEFLRSDASGGTGTLAVNAGLIELVGHSSLQGFGETNLVSQGDIRTRGVVYDADLLTGLTDVDWVYRGSLATGGDLNLAARQIYPASLTEFALEVHNNPAGRITVTSTGADGAVLSAGGKLSLAAPFIEQRGAIKAPFGEIALRSETITRVTHSFGNNGLPSGLNDSVSLTRVAAPNGEVALEAGSLTSVSAEGQIVPLGMTELSGRDWVYDFGSFKKILANAPEKQIVLDGDTVIQAEGARIDLSGGGDVYAYEFLKGPGGSRDILLPETSEGLYAVLPGLDSHFAAYDYQTYRGLENWNPGASVQLLEGTQGLAAGNYALLPARYALLPGAYLVRVRAQNSDQIPGRTATLPNGATWVAGYLGTATAMGDVLHGARTSTLEIRPGSVARQYSEFQDSFASKSFANVAGAQLPGDAGRLSIGVGNSLTLLGELLAGYADGMRGPEVDISADRLAVTSTGASYGAGYVTLSADQLDSLGAASLLLGGARSADGERVRLTQRSDEVVIANDADHVLSAPELILAARDTVKLEEGAVVASAGEFSGEAKDIHIADASGNADGALLRVSTGDQVALTRDPASLTGGVLDVAAGVTVRA
ncbi:MAG: hypothetical protein M1449_02125, partial [Candidatus Thermoplasmatota archaeon]|nr:hypothetical protein [Candidatus Thermoplasmatota archaeon]